MKALVNFLKNNALLIGGFIVLIVLYFKSKKDDKPRSTDDSVNVVIHILDNAFNSIGTFDSDLEPIFPALKKLSKSQLVRLHKDFGFRYYNPLTMRYSLISALEGYAVARKKDLNALYHSEFDSYQIQVLTNIYKSKGLDFPLI